LGDFVNNVILLNPADARGAHRIMNLARMSVSVLPSQIGRCEELGLVLSCSSALFRPSDQKLKLDDLAREEQKEILGSRISIRTVVHYLTKRRRSISDLLNSSSSFLSAWIAPGASLLI
jgi:hypothetical protein